MKLNDIHKGDLCYLGQDEIFVELSQEQAVELLELKSDCITSHFRQMTINSTKRVNRNIPMIIVSDPLESGLVIGLITNKYPPQWVATYSYSCLPPTVMEQVTASPCSNQAP
jgi:hypothetical protein